MPTRLWSTEVIQDQKPVVACGRRSTPPAMGRGSSGPARAVGSRVEVIGSGSSGSRRAGGEAGRDGGAAQRRVAQGAEVGDQRGDLGLRELEVRHPGARLLG